MGDVTDGLNQLFEFFPAHLIQQQRKQDGRWKTEQQHAQADGHRVADSTPGKGAVEELAEVFQPYPFALPYSLIRTVIFKGDYQTG